MMAATDVIRVGMVGAGFMARLHSAAYSLLPITFGRDVPRVELVAIADVVEDHARRAADELGWARWSTDWRDVVGADDVDLIDIVTPNDSHPEIAAAAAGNRKDIVCEKPLASTLTEARMMRTAVERSGVRAGVCFVYRTWPMVELARRMIARGDLGDIHTYRGHFLHDHAIDPSAPHSWRFDRARAGAGALGDIGSHALDLARSLVGEIVEVFADVQTVVHERPMPAPDRRLRALRTVDVDDSAALMLRFASGARGSIDVSWIATGTKTDVGFAVEGTAGALAFSWSRANELRLYEVAGASDATGFRTIVMGPEHPGAERFWPVPGLNIGYQEAFVLMLGGFLANDGVAGAASPTFQDAERISACLDAALTSSQTGRWVRVP